MGAFMTMHKQKREEAVRQSEKIIVENVKIEEKKKELRAKKQRLERLETKVIYDCVIGMLTLSLLRSKIQFSYKRTDDHTNLCCPFLRNCCCINTLFLS